MSFIVGGATLNQTPLDWDGNVARIVRAIEIAKEKGVRLLCMQELTITGYGCEDLFLSEWVPQKALSMLREIVPETEGIAVVVGLPVRFEGSTYNTVALIEDGAIRCIIPKQNLPLDGVHYEPRWFVPWTSGRIERFKMDDQSIPFGDIIESVGGQRVGFEICEDAWRQIRPAQKLRERGVDIILNPSASHFALHKYQDREALVSNSSTNFGCVYVYTNVLGNEAGKMIYDGDILIAKEGEIILRNRTLRFNELEVTSVDIEQPEAAGLPSTRHINEEFAQAVSLGLFDYLRKSRSNGFVVSLSGGADSATCAVMVYEMVRRASLELGWETFLNQIHHKDWLQELTQSEEEKIKRVTGKLLVCAYQGTVNSSDETKRAANDLATWLGAEFHSWSVDELVQTYTDIIATATSQQLNWNDHDLALQNIQARSRAPSVWMLANLRNSLLLVTSNRSEGAVGYATMDGDTSGSLAPIAGIDKPFIRQWLHWAEDELGIRGLRKTNSLVPSAELRPGSQQQTDEDDLMPYDLLVDIERLAIRDRKSPMDIYSKLNAKWETDLLVPAIRTFFRLWSRNQWKRERTAPSFHLDDFSVDPRSWCRFPILSSGFEEELNELDTIKGE